ALRKGVSAQWLGRDPAVGRAPVARARAGSRRGRGARAAVRTGPRDLRDGRARLVAAAPDDPRRHAGNATESADCLSRAEVRLFPRGRRVGAGSRGGDPAHALGAARARARARQRLPPGSVAHRARPLLGGVLEPGIDAAARAVRSTRSDARDVLEHAARGPGGARSGADRASRFRVRETHRIAARALSGGGVAISEALVESLRSRSIAVEPLRIDPVFDDPERVLALIAGRAPYPTLAAYH